jgi:Uncharacterized conserved protein containing a ferredoxin-like domain
MNILATTESIEKTIEALKVNGFEPIHVSSKEEALKKIKKLIPEDVSLMNGASETLREIGIVEYLKSGEHPWKNLHETILAEQDQAKQSQLRREAVISDFYLGSVQAMTETGELMIASNTGSQLPHLAFTSPNIILVAGTNKIVTTLAEGFERLEQHIVPLEDERMKKVYGFGTLWTKTLILHKENLALGRKIYVVIVDENLGF